MKLMIKYYLSCAVIVCVYIIIRSWNFDFTRGGRTDDKATKVDTIEEKHNRIQKDITLIFRYTHESSKHLIGTINSFLSVFPFIPIIIVSDAVIPREIIFSVSNKTQIKNVLLKLDLLNLILDRNVGNHVETKYLLIVPIGVVSLSPEDISSLINAVSQGESSFIVIPVDRKLFRCLRLELNLVQWSIQYRKSGLNTDCDAVEGDHGILMQTNMLSKIGEPFMLPFPEAFYIQTTSLKMKAIPSFNIKLKNKQKEIKTSDLGLRNQFQRQIMNKILKIKKVTRENGLVEWYGCTRKTQRCFPNVINSVPDYINQGRWTPPCCLKVLRETVHHVFRVLKQCNVTFWLEGGSLLGAVRMKDIIPWDYDVDIGIYLEDIEKCPWLQRIHKTDFGMKKQLPSVIDNEGFVWEKATPEEGDFYRVQSSEHNRLHVDIFPFFARNGVMTKKTWFTAHPQDMEFPEHYLKPLTTIEFTGIEAPAPNNIKEFLELKFGKGCVENPQYPNSKLFPFPTKAKILVVNETNNYDHSTNLP